MLTCLFLRLLLETELLSRTYLKKLRLQLSLVYNLLSYKRLGIPSIILLLISSTVNQAVLWSFARRIRLLLE